LGTEDGNDVLPSTTLKTYEGVDPIIDFIWSVGEGLAKGWRTGTGGCGRMPNPVLEATGIVKHFGGVTALDGVDLALFPSEIVALVGDNGAGKSTLVKILSGVHSADGGEISVNGALVRIESPQKAMHLGISTVFQDLALVNERDVAHNMFLGREPCRFGFFVDRKRMRREARQTISALRVGLPSVRSRVGALSGGQRQAIAVARAWQQGGQITLLDEPTAALGVREAGQVKELMVTLRGEGHAILLISHNLESVFELADRIIVLRHGTKIADVGAAATSKHDIISLLTSGRL
jgi:ABC-type sugar transport system ATPase subunit